MDGIDPKRIGLEIKLRRTKRRISQTEFAEFLGVSQTHLSNAENGRTIFSLKILIKIKNCFGCTLDEIVDPDGYQKMCGQQTRLKKFRLVRCDE